MDLMPSNLVPQRQLKKEAVISHTATLLSPRYFMFVCQELSKRLLSGDGMLDLLGYVEFQRNYRCVLRFSVQSFVLVGWLALACGNGMLDVLGYVELQHSYTWSIKGLPAAAG